MVTAQARFTVSVYNSSSTQTPGLLNTSQAGGTVGALGYYPPISSVTGPGSAITGPGGIPLGASPYHGLGHMTNIQVPVTIFPNSNFTVVTVFTYSGADVANYSTRITIPGLGIMNNMSQSASVNGGGAATVQNTMATPAVIPYGPVTGTVELIRNGGVLTVDDVEPIIINSPGGLGGPPGPNSPGGLPPPTGNIPGGTGLPPGTGGQPVPPTGTQPMPPTPGGSNPGLPATSGGSVANPPTPVPPVLPGTPVPPVVPGIPPPVPPVVVPPVVPGMPPVVTPPVPPIPTPITVNVARGSNASRVTLTVTATGFHQGERVLMIMFIDRPGWQWRRWNRHMFVANKAVVKASTPDGQVMHTFMTSIHNNTPLSGHVKVRGLSSASRLDKDFDV